MIRNFVAAKFLGKAPVEAARAWVAQISEVGVRDATPGLPWPCSMGKPGIVVLIDAQAMWTLPLPNDE